MFYILIGRGERTQPVHHVMWDAPKVAWALVKIGETPLSLSCLSLSALINQKPVRARMKEMKRGERGDHRAWEGSLLPVCRL